MACAGIIFGSHIHSSVFNYSCCPFKNGNIGRFLATKTSMEVEKLGATAHRVSSGVDGELSRSVNSCEEGEKRRRGALKQSVSPVETPVILPCMMG